MIVLKKSPYFTKRDIVSLHSQEYVNVLYNTFYIGLRMLRLPYNFRAGGQGYLK